jgi:hypothetical protein
MTKAEELQQGPLGQTTALYIRYGHLSWSPGDEITMPDATGIISIADAVLYVSFNGVAGDPSLEIRQLLRNYYGGDVMWYDCLRGIQQYRRATTAREIWCDQL